MARDANLIELGRFPSLSAMLIPSAVLFAFAVGAFIAYVHRYGWAL